MQPTIPSKDPVSDFSVVGVIIDVDRLESLCYLFAEILNSLCHIGSAYENDPNLEL
jgi:hypothetical protein